MIEKKLYDGYKVQNKDISAENLLNLQLSFLEDLKTAKVPFNYLHKEALLQPKFVVWRGDPRCIPKREVIQHIYWSLKEPVEQQLSSVSAVEWAFSTDLHRSTFLTTRCQRETTGLTI